MNFIKQKKISFIDYFIKKEKEFLKQLSPQAFEHKDFRFYISWFVFAIDSSGSKEDNIVEQFKNHFCNNFELNIIFLPYIVNDNFRKIVIVDIDKYKSKYKKENIY